MKSIELTSRVSGCFTVSDCFKSGWNSQLIDELRETAPCFAVSRFSGKAPSLISIEKVLRAREPFACNCAVPTPGKVGNLRKLNQRAAFPENDETVKQISNFIEKSISCLFHGVLEQSETVKQRNRVAKAAGMG